MHSRRDGWRGMRQHKGGRMEGEERSTRGERETKMGRKGKEGQLKRSGRGRGLGCQGLGTGVEQSLDVQSAVLTPASVLLMSGVMWESVRQWGQAGLARSYCSQLHQAHTAVSAILESYPGTSESQYHLVCISRRVPVLHSAYYHRQADPMDFQNS